LKTSPEHHIHDKVKEKKTPVMPIYIIGGFVIIFLSRFAMVVIYTYFPLYLTEVLHWNVVGLMFALSAIAEIPFIFFSGRLIRRFGSLPLMGLSSVGICLRLLILAFLPFKPCIIAAQLLHCVCFGLFHPAAVHFVTSVFPARKRGTGMSLYMALGTGLPSLIGNMVGGAIVQVAGYQQLFVLYAAIAGASVIMCGWLSKKGEGIGTRD
jgi:PPP family 3-phenylpropionic acid transporter